jgi:hypothetical protein
MLPAVIHEPVSLEIVTWTQVISVTAAPGKAPVFPLEVKIFDKMITDQELVLAAQHQFNGLPRNVVGGCAIASPAYVYEFRFATNGVTTQEYTGSLDCVEWNVVTPGQQSAIVAAADDTTLDGYNLMFTLHNLTGMPLPS